MVGIVRRDGKILMGQRPPHKVFPLMWEFPGGKVEEGESLFGALKRELFEELSIEVLEASACFHETVSYGPEMEYDLYYSLIEKFSGEASNNDFNALGWFSIEELKKLEHLSGNSRLLELIYSEVLSTK